MPSRSRFRRHPFRLGGIIDSSEEFSHEPDLRIRRRRVYEIIDGRPFQKWVVFVAAAGFITDAYDIFAVNAVLPMVSLVYWDMEFMPQSTYTAMLCATLIGSMIGQVAFGVLGDLFGRKRMYGWLLVIILWATFGLAAAADGSHGSMSIAAWLFMWRFFMGIGIGGDYPLSAVITSEFAPRKHRSSMLATLFFMQPLGQFIATIVALVVTFCFRHEMQFEENCQNKNVCYKAIDRAWRWIIGTGGIPALVAMVIRLQIPESPRYTMDVLLNGKKALQDTNGYFFGPEDTPTVEDVDDEHSESSPIPNGASASSPQLTDGETGQENSRAIQAETASCHQNVSLPLQRPKISRRSNQLHYQYDTPHAALSAHFIGPDQQTEDSPFTFSEWWSGFKQYVFTERNWIHLVGTMASWFLLDVSFYGLGMSSPKVIQKIWDGLTGDTSNNRTVYNLLFENSWHSLVVISLGALLGGVAMIYVVQHSRPVKVQSLFFIILGTFLFIAGGTFEPFLVSSDTGVHWILVVFYILCNFSFNLGANATTFIIPAEQFSTPYRCTCHGLAAASGKLGSVFVQLAIGLSSATNLSSTSLGYWLLGFGVLMFVGAIVTQVAVPDSRDADGHSMSLEDLAKGYQYTKELSPQWWNRWHTVGGGK